MPLPDQKTTSILRVGAVHYLNSKPLVEGLAESSTDLRLSFDLPSRLADSLVAGKLDVALLPVYEYFRHAELRIVSDACVACRGPVRSVKLFFRVPPAKVRTLDLDEGSRTSAALARVLLLRQFGLQPKLGTLPIGSGVVDSTADAVLLIGDRAMFDVNESFVETWDLGEKWWQYTGLPFVFAAWVARPNVDVDRVAPQLSAARDRGLKRIDAIAERESEIVRVSANDASDYLRNKLCYRLEHAESCGLASFHDLCVDFGLTQPHPSMHAKGINGDAYAIVG